MNIILVAIMSKMSNEKETSLCPKKDLRKIQKDRNLSYLKVQDWDKECYFKPWIKSDFENQFSKSQRQKSYPRFAKSGQCNY